MKEIPATKGERGRAVKPEEWRIRRRGSKRLGRLRLGGLSKRKVPAPIPVPYEVWLPEETLGLCVLGIRY